MTQLIAPPINTFVTAEPGDPEQHGRNVAAASREAFEREMAMLRAMNESAGKPEPQTLRKPKLPDDFAAHVAALGRKIYERGVVIDRGRFLSLGRERFAELLAADREARTERVIGSRIDLSQFSSVLFAFVHGGAQLPVPYATMAQQYAGADVELDRARATEGFADLWKFYGSEPRAVRSVYVFRDLFESLAFGQSMLPWMEADGRAYQEFFIRGSGDKANYFEAWLPALKGAHYRVKITNALPAIVFWLAGETNVPPNPVDLARDWAGVRLPTQEQICFAQAVLQGWLLGLKDWQLWNFVGRMTRKPPDRVLLESRREELQHAFPRIGVFHHQLGSLFYRPVTDHREFEGGKHRMFIDTAVGNLSNVVSAVVGLTIESASKGALLARFDDWLLLEGKPPKFLQSRIESDLATVFPGARFEIVVNEGAQS